MFVIKIICCTWCVLSLTKIIKNFFAKYNEAEKNSLDEQFRKKVTNWIENKYISNIET